MYVVQSGYEKNVSKINEKGFVVVRKIKQKGRKKYTGIDGQKKSVRNHKKKTPSKIQKKRTIRERKIKVVEKQSQR